MSDSGDEKLKPTDASGAASPEGEPALGSARGDTYDVVESAPAPVESAPAPVEAAASAGQQPSAGWYMARAGGQPQGPFDLAEMKRRVLSGELAARDLVWRDGTPAWVSARDVRELFGPQDAPHGPPPLRSMASSPETAQMLKAVSAVLSDPRFYRITGYLGAAMALLTFLVSLALWAWGRTWFTGALLFVLLFFIGQAAGAVLESLKRLEGGSASKAESKQRTK